MLWGIYDKNELQHLSKIIFEKQQVLRIYSS